MLEISEKLLVQAPIDIAQSKLPCANVIYNSLISDPISVIKGIYLQFGWDYSEEYERCLLAYLEENRLEREGLKLKAAAKLGKREGKRESG